MNTPDPLANFQRDEYSDNWINERFGENEITPEPAPAEPAPAPPEKVPFFLPAPLEPKLTPAEMLKLSEIDLDADIQKPPVCLSIDGQSVFYLGDISTTIGKAKGRKTFATGLFMAAMAGSCTIQDKITGFLPEGKKTVLLFDTEQGSYHAQKAAKRVKRLVGTFDLPNFKAYGLRKFTPAERLEIIEHAIYNTPELGFVCIDGSRDLVTSINDEEQATTITSKLMKWSEELQIHINCILHMNKGDNNARGHLGTELMNKSVTVLGVTKNEKIGDYSTIEPIACRDKEPVPLSFGISEETGLPYILDSLQVEQMQKLSERKKKVVTPADYRDDVHTDNIKLKIFSLEKERSYNDLVNAICILYSVGTNKAKTFVTHFVDSGFIAYRKEGQKTIYYSV